MAFSVQMLLFSSSIPGFGGFVQLAILPTQSLPIQTNRQVSPESLQPKIAVSPSLLIQPSSATTGSGQPNAGTQHHNYTANKTEQCLGHPILSHVFYCCSFPGKASAQSLYHFNEAPGKPKSYLAEV